MLNDEELFMMKAIGDSHDLANGLCPDCQKKSIVNYKKFYYCKICHKEWDK